MKKQPNGNSLNPKPNSDTGENSSINDPCSSNYVIPRRCPNFDQCGGKGNSKGEPHRYHWSLKFCSWPDRKPAQSQINPPFLATSRDSLSK